MNMHEHGFQSSPPPLRGNEPSKTDGNQQPGHADGEYASPLPELIKPSADPSKEGPKPINVLVVTHGDIFLEMDGAVFDLDDTISVGAGEHVHDGASARFAQGLSRLLVGHNKELEQTPFLTPEQLERFAETKSLFTVDDWMAFRGQSGKSEDAVIQGMLEVAIERFELKKFDSLPGFSDFKKAVKDVLKESFPDFMSKVNRDAGLWHLCDNALKHGVKTAVCSASQDEYVRDALEYLEFGEMIDVVVGNAQKKIGPNAFKGCDLRKACEQMGVDPSRVVMFGDSIGDVGAAALAGVGVIVIRLRETDKSSAKKQGAQAAAQGALDARHGHPQGGFEFEINSFQGHQDYLDQLVAMSNPITVLLVKDFSQAKFANRLIEGKERAGYSHSKKVGGSDDTE